MTNEITNYYVPENLINVNVNEVSPSGRYNISVSNYKTGKNTWNVTRGTISSKEGNLISTVDRCYHTFHFTWIEDHPDGHDYLICGEHYMGQTIIQLDTGNRVDTSAKDYGFCWSKVYPSPNKKFLFVSGCYWAVPYEIVLFDFTNPMSLPLKEISRFDEFDDYHDLTSMEWLNDGKIKLVQEFECRKLDMKPINDLTADEYDELQDNDIETVFKKTIVTFDSVQGTLT